MLPLFVNGKFAAQATTGVQRVASRLVQALDERVAPGRWTLLCPPEAAPPTLRAIAVRRVGPPGLPLHLWEQIVLPWAARRGWLLSLAGAAPALARRHVALLPDAAVFDHPEAYTRPFRLWYRWLFRHLGHRAAGLLTVSAFSRGRLAEVLRLPPARFTVLPMGAEHLGAVAADDMVLERHGLGQVPFLLAVGSDNPNKNLPALIRAFARLPAGPLQLVIVGGSNRQVFAGSRAGDGKGLMRLGPVGDAALVALYRQALALVFPSTYEGFGLPPLEAMASGCPVLASRSASIPEVCGEAAFYFDADDPDSIVAALQAVTGDGALRERLRAAGQARAAQFTWGDSAERLLHMLRGLGAPA